MRYSLAGLELTERFEGCRLTAYEDPLKPGLLTIGYGHTGSDVHIGLTWTLDQAQTALEGDIAFAANCVTHLVHASLTQGEFDALVDFVYNMGVGAFSKSTMLKELNAGNTVMAALEFEKWDHAGGKVVAGLLRRRQAEELMFKGTQPA